MEVFFESVLERDIDLLIMHRFSVLDSTFIGLFSEQAGIRWNTDYHIESISHSVMTNDGESDIEIIIDDGKGRTAFLIENKIDAIAQPEQFNRYMVRANKAVEQGRYTDYKVFIVAPEKYLAGNKEASLYPYHV